MTSINVCDFYDIFPFCDFCDFLQIFLSFFAISVSFHFLKKIYGNFPRGKLTQVKPHQNNYHEHCCKTQKKGN